MIYIALLRGINVGGHKKIKMEARRNSLETLHFKNLKTYIQSGNIIFQFKETSTSKIASLISLKIHEDFSYDVPVIVKTFEEFEFAFLNNPFVEENGIEKLYVSFLSTKPSNELKKNMGDFENDHYNIVNDIFYINYEESVSNSKLTNNIIEKKLRLQATTRNWKTISNLYTLAKNYSN